SRQNIPREERRFVHGGVPARGFRRQASHGARSEEMRLLLAELNVRHTRRHMPTRRVALGERVLPTQHPGYGPLLLGCVAAVNIGGLDEEQAEAFPVFLRAARGGLAV